ncbi:MAG: hypothetical protein H6555_06680, partial [Lewinellaceae bacterium]|nr:hypothetical protein [Lewinellaceae bacterium]
MPTRQYANTLTRQNTMHTTPEPQSLRMFFRTALFLLLLLGGIIHPLTAQTTPCYRVLLDGPGLAIKRDAAATAACAARDSLPSTQRNMLGIYSAIDYPLAAYYTPAFADTARQYLLRQAASTTPYYLLFRWEATRTPSGLPRLVDYDLSLPPDCLAPSTRARLEVALTTALAAPLGHPDDLPQREMTAIRLLATYLGQLRRCCVDNPPAACSTCLEAADALALLQPTHQHRYSGVDTTGTPATPASPLGVLRSGSNYTATFLGPEVLRMPDGRQVDVAAALGAFTSGYAEETFALLLVDASLQGCFETALDNWLTQPATVRLLVWVDVAQGQVDVRCADPNNTGAVFFLEEWVTRGVIPGVDASGIFKKKADGKYQYSELADAFLVFAKSTEGYSLLSRFGKKGQVIAPGVKAFGQDGEFQMLGIDLLFMAFNLNYGDEETGKSDVGANGLTGFYSSGGERKLIRVSVNFELNENNIFAAKYKLNLSREEEKTNYIFSRVRTYFHEMVMHAVMDAEDWKDNRKMDLSNIPNSITKKSRANAQHDVARDSKSLWNSKYI